MSRAKNFVHSQILKDGAAGFSDYFKIFKKNEKERLPV